MWTWTCSGCGAVFTGDSAEIAEAGFLAHARSAHRPTTIASFNSEAGKTP